jgi:hypothetical protein
MPLNKISQNISSDSLFHFVKRRDWLLEILKNKFFQARYVYEELPKVKFKFGIPMKCFCDIPLGMIKTHITRYGKFGIGITKIFAKQHCFSPVIYIHENSDTFIRYLDTIKKSDAKDNPSSLLPYFKLDEYLDGTREGTRATIRLYDEREWRFIPPNPRYIDFSGFDEDEIRRTRLEYENKKLADDGRQYVLPFKYKDITYIFVQKDDDVDKIIDEIHRLPISQREADHLIANIITSRQIERDF